MPENPFTAWLRAVLEDGDGTFAEAPDDEEDYPDALPILEAAYRIYALDIAGVPPPFVPTVGLAAARTLYDCCWTLVSSEPVDVPDRLTEPRSAGDHASADLCLRHVIPVFHRLGAREPDGPTYKMVKTVLRRFPLSGVLADLDEPPLGDLQFHGHAGLQALYAERLLNIHRPQWVPKDGLCRERVELVFESAGRTLPK